MSDPILGTNFDPQVLDGFGEEWQRFDQSTLSEREAESLFERYFSIFPWARLPSGAVGFDAGCGSGRWASLVAPRVAKLYCIDASEKALGVAAKNLSKHRNCSVHLGSIEDLPLPDGSTDFGYSLGVLHHVPDTAAALRECVRKLKRGAPFLLYLYYRFDNRPAWFRALWWLSNGLRLVISRAPFRIRAIAADSLAATVYWPLARIAALAERCGACVDNLPLSGYRDRSFYVMRTDALDRFGTRLEKRFTRDEIQALMEGSGLTDVVFRHGEPYWVALGYRAVVPSTDAGST